MVNLEPGMTAAEVIETAKEHIRWFELWAVETTRCMEAELEKYERHVEAQTQGTGFFKKTK